MFDPIGGKSSILISSSVSEDGALDEVGADVAALGDLVEGPVGLDSLEVFEDFVPFPFPFPLDDELLGLSWCRGTLLLDCGEYDLGFVLLFSWDRAVWPWLFCFDSSEWPPSSGLFSSPGSSSFQ